jgi:hypothetical protein
MVISKIVVKGSMLILIEQQNKTGVQHCGHLDFIEF